MPNDNKKLLNESGKSGFWDWITGKHTDTSVAPTPTPTPEPRKPNLEQNDMNMIENMYKGRGVKPR